MLDDTMKSQLQAYWANCSAPFPSLPRLTTVHPLASCARCCKTLLRSPTGSPFSDGGTDARKPSFVIAREGEASGVRFAGIPMGHEFTSLVLALLWTGGHPPKVEADVIEQIKALDGDYAFEVYMSLSCHNCPDVVQATER